ncbi:MAG: 16S rRNA (adenine(1518)-N(6)/adenine(1519)-N(6))-dimethyltransferase RsmA [Pseudomonadota bacterium]
MTEPSSRRSIGDLPPLREVIRTHNLNARKSLGQNFILDLNLTAKIARIAGDLERAHVVEVGPGPGGLTRAILSAGATHVTAIERDERCLVPLDELRLACDDRLHVLSADALEIDYSALSPQPYRIIANLPYSVATPLLTGWLTSPVWPPPWHSMTLMFQKEVADRIVASPGSKAYGRLSVLAQWRSVPQIRMVLPPEAFTPPPKISSAIVHFTPQASPLEVPSIAALERITAAAFGQRRKMLRASLKSLAADAEWRIESCELSPTARAEEIDVAGFCALAQAFEPSRTPNGL